MGQDGILRADGIGPPCVCARAKDRLTIGPQDAIQDAILPYKARQQCNGYFLTIPKRLLGKLLGNPVQQRSLIRITRGLL